MFRTIRARLYLLVALVSAALVMVGGYGGWRASRARAETEQLSNLEVARTAAAAVGTWVAEVSHESGILGRAVSGGRLGAAEAGRLLAEAARDSGTVRDYSWVSPAGRVLASSEPRLVGLPAAGDRPELVRLQAGDEVAVGDLVRNPLDGAPVVTVATAVRDGAGRLTGALLATVAPGRLAARVLPARGDRGSAALMDRSGALVAQVPDAPLTWEERQAAGRLDLVRAALAGREATGPARSSGPERLAAAVPVPTLGWVVRASQPGAAVLGPLRREIALGVMAAGLLSVLALLATGSVGSRAVAALRRLERHAEALGRGDAAAPLEGPAEVVRLAQTYEEMAEHLGAVRRRFQAVFEDAPIGVAILDPLELRVRYANRTLLSFLDEPFCSDGADGRRLDEILPRAGEQDLRALARRALDGEGDQVQGEWRYDGFARGPTWWRGSLRAVDSAEGGRDLVLVVTDITDVVRAREQVEADRRRLEAVLATLPAGVLIADAGGQVVHVNDAARRIWGSAGPLGIASIFRERRARLAETGEPLAPSEWPLLRALRSGQPCAGEVLEIDRFDGAQATIVNSSAPIRDAEGRTVGAVSALLDVTELRRAVRNRDELLQMVSHDLRTPLSTVALAAASLERLPDGAASGAHARRAGQRISAAAGRMARLIDDLLDLQGLEEGRVSIRPAPVDPTDLLGEAADQLREAARQKGLDLCLSAEPGLPSVACDRDRVLQVLGNVASNAVKATERGAVSLAAESQGDAVVFRVRDTGPGIPEEDLPHVFDRYRRGRDASWPGTGLGLAIARALVEAHGGRIWAESSEGEGTSVTFTLPAWRGEGELAAGLA